MDLQDAVSKRTPSSKSPIPRMYEAWHVILAHEGIQKVLGSPLESLDGARIDITQGTAQCPEAVTNQQLQHFGGSMQDV
jgi:hypothetical protein